MGWTLDELADRVGRALSSADGAGHGRPPNGRARQVPDRRAIRWYTTIGLVDRPLPTGGRLARYGPRHLRQLVAVKRLQARGLSLAEIQAELAGASDATLTAIAQLPDDVLAGWQETPARAARSPGNLPEAPDAARDVSARTGNRAGDARFWTATPGAVDGAERLHPKQAHDPQVRDQQIGDARIGDQQGGDQRDRERQDRDLRDRERRDRERRDRERQERDHVVHDGRCPRVESGGHPLLTGVPLGGGAVLLLPATPRPADLEMIMTAARPLLDALAARDLLCPNPRTGDRRSTP